MLRISADALVGEVWSLSLPMIRSLQISAVDLAVAGSSALRWRRRSRIWAGARGVGVWPLSLLPPSWRTWAGAHDDAAWWSSLPLHPPSPMLADARGGAGSPLSLRRHPRLPISAVDLAVAGSLALRWRRRSRISAGALGVGVWPLSLRRHPR